MSRENLEIVRRLFEAFQARFESFQVALERDDPGLATALPDDFESELGALADDFEWIPVAEIPGPSSYRGLEGFVQFMRTWTEDFERWSFVLERLVEADDDRVVAMVHQWGLGKGSGAPVELHFATVFELEDGRVTRMQNYLHPAGALEAVGLSP
jgi:ketosteroid isomerase-like protein